MGQQTDILNLTIREDDMSEENTKWKREKKKKKKKRKKKRRQEIPENQLAKLATVTLQPSLSHTLTTFKTVLKWWQKPSIQYAFCHPYVRSKLEKLMGSNLVSLTDREYMQKLQERILEDYAYCMSKRIVIRRKEEMERVKSLVLSGKIPLDQAPPEMANHPVMIIEMYCNRLIAERRAKIKVPRIYIPTHLYSDDTPDPPSGLSIESGHRFRTCNDRLCTPPDHFLSRTDEEDQENGYMFTDEDYERMKYESPMIKQLQECETVEEMYALADEIIGILASIDYTEDEIVAPAAAAAGADVAAK